MNFGYSINKICHQYFKKIAQSGQTDDVGHLGKQV